MPPRHADPRDPDEIAYEALAYLAADPDRLERFLALTGLTPDTIRSAAAEPGFPAAILDHVASDEGLMIACADAIGIPPEGLAAARAKLAPREHFP